MVFVGRYNSVLCTKSGMIRVSLFIADYTNACLRRVRVKGSGFTNGIMFSIKYFTAYYFSEFFVDGKVRKSAREPEGSGDSFN